MPPTVNAKTAQRHDYPGPAWSASYARRSGAEPWHRQDQRPGQRRRLDGPVPAHGPRAHRSFLATAVVVPNLAVTDAFEVRQAEDARRAASGQAARTRRRGRKTLAQLAGPPRPS